MCSHVSLMGFQEARSVVLKEMLCYVCIGGGVFSGPIPSVSSVWITMICGAVVFPSVGMFFLNTHL